jgi:hypothetical protein
VVLLGFLRRNWECNQYDHLAKTQQYILNNVRFATCFGYSNHHQADISVHGHYMFGSKFYRGADKSLARPGRKQATATEDFEFHISYL